MSTGKPEGAYVQRVLTESDRPTFSVVITDFTPVATATDILNLVASPTRLVRITRVTISADQTTGSTTADVYLVKRTAANTGGASTNPTITKHDSQDPNPTATAVLYSANPAALGTGSNIRGDHIIIAPSSGGQVGVLTVVYDFGDRAAKCPILRPGTAEQLSINWGGNAVPAGTLLYMNIEWTEEDPQ